MQFESSSPSRYSITRSLSLREVLAAQAAADGGSAEEMLAAIQAGQVRPNYACSLLLQHSRKLALCFRRLQRIAAGAGKVPGPEHLDLSTGLELAVRWSSLPRAPTPRPMLSQVL